MKQPRKLNIRIKDPITVKRGCLKPSSSSVKRITPMARFQPPMKLQPGSTTHSSYKKMAAPKAAATPNAASSSEN